MAVREYLNTTQVCDARGMPLDGVGATEYRVVTSEETGKSLFTGLGVLWRIVITKECAAGNGIITIKNNAGTTLWTAKLDVKGTYHIRKKYTAGIKFDTTNFATDSGELLVIYDT